jgi:hypothetical protein
VLTFQSVVDATVPPIPSLTRLYSRVLDAKSELVVFDANRSAAVAPLLATHVDELLTVGAGRTYPFAVTLVTNASATSDAVIARHWRAGEITATAEPLALAWPRGVYSLSHVALPFPPDDPVYGVDAPERGPFPLGRLEVRGERGAFLVPAEQLTRLRYDPFFAYVEGSLLRFVDARLGASLPSAPSVSPTRPH